MDFDKAVQIILELEKGYSMLPTDPGGETNYGISKAQYKDLDIRNLKKDDARSIYFRDYWRSLRCDELPPGLRLLVFDAAINQGQPSAIRMLQRAVGVTPDGVFGPRTMFAVRSLGNDAVAVKFCTERALRYCKTKNFHEFGEGWFKRLFTVALLSKEADTRVLNLV